MSAVAATGERDVLPLSFSTVSVDADNVICEVVKRSERDEDTIVRLYEHKNKRTRATVSLGIPASEVYLCDMMENELEAIPVNNGRLELSLNGFEIVTLKVRA